eukprot:symbB.v1.2.000638.t1/scaffold7.1/size571927/6
MKESLEDFQIFLAVHEKRFEDKLDLTPQQAHYLDCASQFFNDAGLRAFMDKWSFPFGYASDCSGMDAPLMAIRDLFGVAGKSHLVKYMSNSERDNYAREFLEANFETPFQHLGL